MSKKSDFLSWSFDPLISSNPVGLPIPSLTIDECELCIIWKLGEKGILSVYNLRTKEVFNLPKQVNSPIVTEIPKEKAGEEERYQSPFIYKTIKKLEKKELVKASKGSYGLRTREMIELTFSGLSLYLRGSVDKHRFKNAINQHPELIPFWEQWESIKKLSGEEKCTEAFSKTANSCINLLKARFRVRPLKLDFEGYMKTTFPPNDNLRRTSRERDEKLSEYLRTEKALVLRNSYIAYVAMKDLSQLSGKNLDAVEGTLSKLESEKEFSYLVKNRDPTPLFKSKIIFSLWVSSMRYSDRLGLF